MSVAETEADVCAHSSSLLLLVTQRGAIVGKMQSIVWKLCCLLQLLDGQSSLNQLRLLLLLSVVVEIDGSTGHCIATNAIRDDSVLSLLSVKCLHSNPGGEITYISESLKTSVAHGSDISMTKLHFEDYLTLVEGCLVLESFSTLLKSQCHLSR